MAEVVKNKCVQVERFRKKLRSSNKHAIFVKSTYNDTWVSGLTGLALKHQTSCVAGEKFARQNHLLSCKKIPKKGNSEQWSRPKQIQQPKESSKQREIVKILKELRAQSDNDSFSEWDSSDSKSDAQSLQG